MKYMLLIFSNPENWAFTQRVTDSGEFVSGEPLRGPETASVVRVTAGSRAISDGPFVESKEVLAGYYVVECGSLDRALELAAMIPDARMGAVEVRPVADFPAPA